MTGNTITITGNLAEDPQLKFTNSGVAVANLTVLENRRVRTSDGNYVDATPNRYRVRAWRHQAEHVAASLSKGAGVIVTGSLQTESYDKDGETRYSTVVVADVVGVSLQYQTAKVQRVKTARPGEDDGQSDAETTSADPFEGSAS